MKLNVMVLRTEVDETQKVHGQTELHPGASTNEGISQLIGRISYDGSFRLADECILDLELSKRRELVQDLGVGA